MNLGATVKHTGRLINSGKITIPAHIRDALDLEDGDLVEVSIDNVEILEQKP